MHASDEDDELNIQPTNFSQKTHVSSNLFKTQKNTPSNPNNIASKDTKETHTMSQNTERDDFEDNTLSQTTRNLKQKYEKLKNITSEKKTGSYISTKYDEDFELIDAEDDEPEHPSARDSSGERRGTGNTSKSHMTPSKYEQNPINHTEFYQSPDFKPSKDFENNPKIQNLISFGAELSDKLNSARKAKFYPDRQHNTDRLNVSQIPENRSPLEHSKSPTNPHNISADHGIQATKHLNVRRSTEKVEKGYNVEYGANKRKLKPLQSANQRMKTGGSENRLHSGSSYTTQTNTPGHRTPQYNQVSSSEHYTGGNSSSAGKKMMLPKIQERQQNQRGSNQPPKRARHLSEDQNSSRGENSFKAGDFFDGRVDSHSLEKKTSRRKTNPLTQSIQQSTVQQHDTLELQHTEGSQVNIVNGIVKQKVKKLNSEHYFTEKIAYLLDSDIRTKSDKELITQNNVLRKVAVELKTELKRILQKTKSRDPTGTRRTSPNQKSIQLCEEIKYNEEILLAQQEEMWKLERALSKANNVEYVMELNSKIDKIKQEKKRYNRDNRHLEYLQKKDFYQNMGNPVIPEQQAQKKKLGKVNDKREEVDRLRRQTHQLQQKNNQSAEFIVEQTGHLEQLNERHNKLLVIAQHLGVIEDPQKQRRRDEKSKRHADLTKAIEIHSRAIHQREKMNQKELKALNQDIDYEQRICNHYLKNYERKTKALVAQENEMQHYQNIQYNNLWDPAMNDYLLRADDETHSPDHDYRVMVSPNIGSMPDFQSQDTEIVRDRKIMGSVSSPPLKHQQGHVMAISESENEGSSPKDYGSSSRRSPEFRSKKSPSSSSSSKDIRSRKISQYSKRSPEMNIRGKNGITSEPIKDDPSIFVDQTQGNRIFNDERPEFSTSGLLRAHKALDKKDVANQDKNDQIYVDYGLQDENIFSSKEDPNSARNRGIGYYKSLKADKNLRRMATSTDNQGPHEPASPKQQIVRKRDSVLTYPAGNINARRPIDGGKKFLVGGGNSSPKNEDLPPRTKTLEEAKKFRRESMAREQHFVPRMSVKESREGEHDDKAIHEEDEDENALPTLQERKQLILERFSGNNNELNTIKEEEKTLPNKPEPANKSTIKAVPVMNSKSDRNSVEFKNQETPKNEFGKKQMFAAEDFVQDKEHAEVNYTTRSSENRDQMPQQQELTQKKDFNSHRSEKFGTSDMQALSSQRSAKETDPSQNQKQPVYSAQNNLNSARKNSNNYKVEYENPSSDNTVRKSSQNNRLSEDQDQANTAREQLHPSIADTKQDELCLPGQLPSINQSPRLEEQKANANEAPTRNNSKLENYNPLNSNLNSMSTQRFEANKQQQQQNSSPQKEPGSRNVPPIQNMNLARVDETENPPKKFSIGSHRGDSDGRPNSIRRSNLRGSHIQMKEDTNLETEVLTGGGGGGRTHQQQINEVDEFVRSHELSKGRDTANEFVRRDLNNKGKDGSGVDIFNVKDGNDHDSYNMKDLITRPLEPSEDKNPFQPFPPESNNPGRPKRLRMNNDPETKAKKQQEAKQKQLNLVEKAEKGGNDFFSDLNF